MIFINIFFVLLLFTYIYMISTYKLEFMKTLDSLIKKHSKYVIITYSILISVFTFISIYETQNELAFTFNFIPLVMLITGLLLKKYNLINVSFLFTPIMIFSILNTFTIPDTTNILKSFVLLITIIISINHVISNQKLILKSYLIFSHFIILGTSVLFLTTFYMAKTNILYLGMPQRNLLFIFDLLNESFVFYSLSFVYIICKSMTLTRKHFNKNLIKYSPDSLEEVPEDKIIYY